MAFTLVVDGGDDSIAERWNLKLRFLLDDPNVPRSAYRFDHLLTFLEPRGHSPRPPQDIPISFERRAWGIED